MKTKDAIKKNQMDYVYKNTNNNTEFRICCIDLGIGSALYNEVVRYAKMRKCHAITLNVWEGNEAARAFYDKMGFAPQKTVMEKVL